MLQTVLALGASVLFGTWISRIIEQSGERADVIAELERTRAELAAVSHEAGVLAERERLAREIHDTLAQGFTSVLMLRRAGRVRVDADPAAARRRLAVARETARENLAEARALVAALTPVDLQAAPLPEAVGRLVDRFGGETGLPATVEVAGEPRPLPANQEVVLLRAAQEALANVRRHAGRCRGRGRAAVRRRRHRADGRRRRRRLRCRTARPPRGYGLAGMRRRVEEVGGTLLVRSAPAAGTTVRVTGCRDSGCWWWTTIRWSGRACGRCSTPSRTSTWSARPAPGEEAVRLAAELRPDVVLMDLRMPGMDGVAATGRITAAGRARVLVVTTYDTDADILRAVEAGATGYLLKDTPRRDLADAVRAAARGETVLAPPVAREAGHPGARGRRRSR